MCLHLKKYIYRIIIIKNKMLSINPDIKLSINKLKYSQGVMLGHIMNLNKDLTRVRNELNSKNLLIEKLEKNNYNYSETQKKLTKKLDELEENFKTFTEEVKAENIRRALEEEQRQQETLKTIQTNDVEKTETVEEDVEDVEGEEEYTEEEITVEETVEETEEEEEEEEEDLETTKN